RLLPALGADLRRIPLEGHVREPLAMQAAKIRLVAVEIRRAEPIARDAATRDDLEIPARRLGLDLLALVERAERVRTEEMRGGLLLGEEQAPVLPAAEKRGMPLVHLDLEPVALPRAEEQLGDIEQRVDARAVLDLLHDE